jgi:hypothetical protein
MRLQLSIGQASIRQAKRRAKAIIGRLKTVQLQTFWQFLGEWGCQIMDVENPISSIS